jgi:hypothetical protein
MSDLCRIASWCLNFVAVVGFFGGHVQDATYFMAFAVFMWLLADYWKDRRA